MFSAMVLSAGLGTRLRPLSEWRAKPLVPVGDTHVLGHALSAVHKAGASRVVVNAHHFAAEVGAYARLHGAVVSEEPTLLGTAGGVAKALPILGPGSVLVWSGDIMCDLDVGALVAAHRSEATLAVLPRAAGSGNVGIAEDGRIVRLRRETTGPGEVQGGEFLAIHVLGEALARLAPAEGCLVGDVYLPALRRGARLEAHVVDTPFWPVGTVPTYLEANLAWLSARGLSSWVAPGARVAPSVTLDRAIVLAGATVEGEGTLSCAVVWEGARCEAPLANVIVAREGTVPVVENA